MIYSLKVPDDIWHIFKVECVKANVTMKDVIIGLIRSWITEQKEKEETK